MSSSTQGCNAVNFVGPTSWKDVMFLEHETIGIDLNFYIMQEPSASDFEIHLGSFGVELG